MLDRVYEKMEEDFKENMPKTLYMNYNELSETFGSTPQAWETLLDRSDFKRYIDSRLAKYMEIDARKALNRLSNSKELASSDISALNKLIENSKLLQQKHQHREIVVLSYMPNPSLTPHTEKEEKENDGNRPVSTELTRPRSDV